MNTYPDNPFIGQTIEIGGTTKQWNGYAWVNVTNGNKELRLRELEGYKTISEKDVGNIFPTSTQLVLAVGDTLETTYDAVRIATDGGVRLLYPWGGISQGTVTGISTTPNGYLEYTVTTVTGSVPFVTLETLNLREALDPRGWGAVPYNKRTQMDWETPITDGVDSTLSIKKALEYAQTIGRQDDNTAYQKAGNLNLNNNSYIVSGENPLGAQLNDGSTYHYSINNGQIIWNRGSSQALFGGYDFNNARKLNLSKLKILITGNSDVSGVVFAFGETGSNVRIGGGHFSEVEISCGSVQANATENCCETVFSCGGDTLADRFSINECSINGFQKLFELDNAEAVSWAFKDTSALTGRDNASFFNFNKNWSGSMHITGCDIIGLGNNNTVFSAKNNNDSQFSIATVHVSSRFEMRGTGCNWFDIEHSDFIVTGMNQLAGSGSKTGHTAFSLKQGATLDFTNSTMVKTVRLWTINTLTASRKGKAKLTNCSFEGGEPIVGYGLSSGDIRSIISSGYKTTTMEVAESNRTVNGVWGVPVDERGSFSERWATVGKTNASGIYRINSGGAPYVTVIPSNSFITQVDIVSAGRPSGTDRLWLYLDGVPVKYVTLGSASSTSKYELIGGYSGAYVISPAPANENVEVTLVVTDNTDTPYSNADQSTLTCWAEISHRPVKSQSDYGTATLVGLK